MSEVSLINGHKTVLMDHNRLITFDDDLHLREVSPGSIGNSNLARSDDATGNRYSITGRPISLNTRLRIYRWTLPRRWRGL